MISVPSPDMWNHAWHYSDVLADSANETNSQVQHRYGILSDRRAVRTYIYVVGLEATLQPLLAHNLGSLFLSE